MDKIWKSRLAMRFLCPAYLPDAPDPVKMELCRALHEQVRLMNRLKMRAEGCRLLDSEVPIENDLVKGYVDDVVQTVEGEVAAVEYVSSFVPSMYKFYDAAISACCLTDNYGMNVSAWVVPREGVVRKVPQELIKSVRSMIMSPEFRESLCRSSDELLESANPASGICCYCANKVCQRRPRRSSIGSAF